jgi:acyl-coenzyme A thioesterase PaaI-like protein
VVLKRGWFRLRLSKKKRQSKLVQSFRENPFLTDEEVAKQCEVSIQTIRLDRLELGIPEMRERLKHMAERSFDEVRSLSPEEVIGEVVSLELDQNGISVLEISEDHVFERNQIARGHYLFAQANSLAVAIVNADLVLTHSAEIRFVRPVTLGEKCVAYAKVVQKQPSRFQVDVETKVQDDMVFQGVFDVYRATN